MPNMDTIGALNARLNERILGQARLVDRLVIALLSDGHLLVEGAPGLAKTTAIKALAEQIDADFQRIQFTPDLLPADITGTDVYHPQDGSFSFQPGPIFRHIVLADEINRAPAKVQSALLEAMGERQVSIGSKTHSLPDLFMVMATQNPIEQEGTYPLPEAQLDRFLMYVKIDYPDTQTEQSILQLARDEALNGKKEISASHQRIAQESIFSLRKEILRCHMSDELERYIVELILASRDPSKYGDDLAAWISYGASPRGTIALDRCARAHAWLKGRDFVTPDDIHQIAHDVLRHRILLTFAAEAQGITSDDVISELLTRVAVP